MAPPDPATLVRIAQPAWLARTQVLLDSFRLRLQRELLPRSGEPADESRRLFEAPFVVVAHGVQADPLLDYANQPALDLWETTLDGLLGVPSRCTAEPVHRDERARMLERTRRDGFIADYRGVRISTTGRRFLIERAIVWNLVERDGAYAGQAAMFREWTPLPDTAAPDPPPATAAPDAPPGD